MKSASPKVLSEEIFIPALSDLENWATGFASTLSGKEILLFDGVMGAGKTQTVAFLVKALSGQAVQSPTFAIHHRYATIKGVFDHIDLYRMQDLEDLESTGFWDLLQSSQGMFAVEWADRLEDSVWPKTRPRIHVRIEVTGESSRKLTIQRFL